tara:strand:- start:415 stop:1023 length:609 start_codon:yes stop_codon:yes gene_type:complete
MNKKHLIISLVILGLILLPIISAYTWGGGYYSSPLDYLDNEWVRFGAIFVIFFAISYYTINKSIRNNGVAAIIALGIALFISLAVARRGLLYGYAGDELGTWVLIVAAITGLAFLVKFAFNAFGRYGVIGAILLLWSLIHFIDPYDFVPYYILGSDFFGIYEFIASWWGFVIIAIISTIIIASKGKKTVRDLQRKIEEAKVK